MSKTQDAPAGEAGGAPEAVPGLSRFPRARLAHTPTPLEELPNLAAALGSGPVWVKRDDCTGLAMGGNKARQLEFYFGEAQAQAADVVLITGAVQSNYVRMAAAAARKLGMDIHIQLENRVPKDDYAYRNSGNVLLDKLLGATLHYYPHGEDEGGADEKLEALAEGLRGRGRKPYVIHLSPENPPLGALGYVVAAAEILAQLREQGQEMARIFVASGSGYTHAGLLVGLRALGCATPVTGVCVRRNGEAQRERIRASTRKIATMLGLDGDQASDADIEITDRMLAPGYGQLNPQTIEAIRMAGETEGLLLDPVYTCNVFAEMVAQLREGQVKGAALFVHTGGAPALFGYERTLSEALLNEESNVLPEAETEVLPEEEDESGA